MQRQGGLFGPTPQELQMGLMEQQQQADQQAAQQWGRQNLGQQISTGAYGSALSFGRGLQNLGQQTGVLPQDPRLDEARRLMGIKKEIMDSGIDPQNIDAFYPALISKMMSGGMVDKATALQEDYMQLKGRQSTVDTKKVEAEAKLADAKFKLDSMIRNLTKDEEERNYLKGKVAMVKRRLPELTDEEALGIASDSGSFSKLVDPKEPKTEVVSANGRRLLINSANGDIIKDLGVAGKGLGEGLGDMGAAIGAGIAGAANVKKAAEASGAAAGKGAGEGATTIQTKYNTDTSIKEALTMLEKGIYSGPFGPAMENAAKYTRGGIGSLDRVANTEEFRSHIGNVVIPRLSEFGGNDSNEELRYLQQVLAADTKLELKATKNILKSAEKKINRGIERAKAAELAARTGQPPPMSPNPPGVTSGAAKTKSGTSYTVVEE